MPPNFMLFYLREAIQYCILEWNQKLGVGGCDFLDGISATHSQYRIVGFNPLKQNAN